MALIKPNRIKVITAILLNSAFWGSGFGFGFSSINIGIVVTIIHFAAECLIWRYLFMLSKDIEEWGKFPELTSDENALIHKARNQGWAVFFPAFPTAHDQAARTLSEAKKFLERYAR